MKFLMPVATASRDRALVEIVPVSIIAFAATYGAQLRINESAIEGRLKVSVL